MLFTEQLLEARDAAVFVIDRAAAGVRQATLKRARLSRRGECRHFRRFQEITAYCTQSRYVKSKGSVFDFRVEMSHGGQHSACNHACLLCTSHPTAQAAAAVTSTSRGGEGARWSFLFRYSAARHLFRNVPPTVVIPLFDRILAPFLL